jgi:hypothetical protein
VPANGSKMDMIDSALFALCLEDHQPDGWLDQQVGRFLCLCNVGASGRPEILDVCVRACLCVCVTPNHGFLSS